MIERVTPVKDCKGCEEREAGRLEETPEDSRSLIRRVADRALKRCPPLSRKHPFCGPRSRLNLRRRKIDGKTLTLQCAVLKRWESQVVPKLQRKGIQYWVASTYRTPKEQRAICERICGRPSCPGLCAAPCHSAHQMGAALDTGAVHYRDVKEFRRIMSDAGFCNFSGPSGSDPNHWNLAGCF